MLLSPPPGVPNLKNVYGAEIFDEKVPLIVTSPGGSGGSGDPAKNPPWHTTRSDNRRGGAQVDGGGLLIANLANWTVFL